MVFQQVKILFLNLIALFRRALCCFSVTRRRSPSFSEHTLQTVNVIVDSGTSPGRSDVQYKYKERDWNSWDDGPRTVEEHIEQYRQRIGKPPTPQKEEQEPDFFSELTPVIQPQPKYYMGEDRKEQIDFSRLEAKTDVPITTNAELEDWMEDDSGGWEELSTEQTKQLIREKRREMRNQRQKGIKSNVNPIQDTIGIGATRQSNLRQPT